MAHHDATTHITEVYASTRAYPSWWSELEDGKVLRRRRSSVAGDSVLERNICFVDTPGWGNATSVSVLKGLKAFVKILTNIVFGNHHTSNTICRVTD